MSSNAKKVLEIIYIYIYIYILCGHHVYDWMIYRAPLCDRLPARALDIAKVTFYKTDLFSTVF